VYYLFPNTRGGCNQEGEITKRKGNTQGVKQVVKIVIFPKL